MKRDMDLVRKILFALEEHPHGYPPDKLNIEGYDEETIGYHVLLMIEAGLLEGREDNVLGIDRNSPSAIPERLTWLGHDFLDASRDPSRWEEARGIFSKLGGVTIDVAMKVLTEILARQAQTLM